MSSRWKKLRTGLLAHQREATSLMREMMADEEDEDGDSDDSERPFRSRDTPCRVNYRSSAWWTMLQDDCAFIARMASSR